MSLFLCLWLVQQTIVSSLTNIIKNDKHCFLIIILLITVKLPPNIVLLGTIYNDRGTQDTHNPYICSCINLEVCIHIYRCIINKSNVISIPDTPTSATRRSGCEDAFSANFLNSSSFSPYAYCLSNLTRTALCFPMTCLRKKL